ncbi:DMT family transporter [Comamonas humi]
MAARAIPISARWQFGSYFYNRAMPSSLSTTTLTWIYLLTAITAEVIATSSLKASNGFTRLGPSVLTVLGYGVAFYCLSLTLRHMPVGVAYAVWSGLGVVLITAVSWVLFGQKLDLPALLGMGLIVAGVLVMNLFSKTVGH